MSQNQGNQNHERFFGLVRPDGTSKPHAEVMQSFAARRPQVQRPSRVVELDISPEAYYENPLAHAKRLYNTFRK
jgi:hypothetical protein